MSSCHTNTEVDLKNHKDKTKLVLAGNPNVGKSVFFNALTGMYVDVSNFPGTTVDISQGVYKNYVVLDTPGVYGVSSFNDEERVARDVILNGDIILNVVDAVHMDRDLFLTQQLIDMGKRVIVALNMMDDVERNGLQIDVKKLSELLGVPVIPTIAVSKQGMEKLKSKLETASTGNTISGIKNLMQSVIPKVSNPAEALLVLEEDENVIERNHIDEKYPFREKIYLQRRKRVNEIVNSVVTETSKGASFKTRLSQWMLKPITGIPILLITLFIMYQFLGVFIAQIVVGFTEEVVMGTYYNNFIMNVFSPLVKGYDFLEKFLIGEFGVLTMVPVYIVGLLLPLVIGFYFLLSILEDSGYLPRIAALMDRVLTKLGLNGRAIIPIILGFGCVTMATITTRILGSKRERFIATMLLGLAIPCSAQLGVIAGMISAIGPVYFLIYLATIMIVFVLAGTLLNLVVPGESTDLLIDIPPLRMPRIKNVLSKTYSKSVAFLKEASPLFVIGAVLITFMDYFGILLAIQNAVAPLTEGFLKLPKEVANAFIMGIVRRDFGAAGLFKLAEEGLLSTVQILISLVVITLFVPCIAAILVIFKERSLKEALIIWFGSMLIAFLVGGLLAFVLV
ncbi:ferrous iron transport protein B [Defluviitalea raffinosedens]|uniref:Ferrous iron transport protein B n=1 Tax=Defluviitalea raffinosedens TaxID=1450156 RepID=A0A7C8HF49_9FIRM|nr:ferrous iron transport protein B [Defluviitalea raffinosedens]KAE9635473.1 ferrous iron transport protein B [Defluviitalea raffinosedens]